MHRLDVQQITIIGTGLLGGSVGLALRGAGYKGRIVGCGRRPAIVDLALKLGCIDHAASTMADAVKGSGLVVLCTPVGLIPKQLEELGGLVEPGTIVTDVGSTKRTIVAAGERHIQPPARFVGSHPMAGGAAQGPEHARADLFESKPAIVTPTGFTDPVALRLIERFWLMLGMHVHRMSADQHDRTIARISHLPHAVAVLLVALADREGGLEVASTGFADSTRIAAGDPELWADIFLDNRDQLLENFEEWSASLHEFRHMIESGRRDQLVAFLAAAQRARTNWRRDPAANGKFAEPT